MSAPAPRRPSRRSLGSSIAGALGAVLVMAVVASCLVSRKSSDFECSTSDPCDGGRVCEDGYCVEVKCPAACNNGCDPILKTCNIRCEQTGRCGDVVCPNGYACTISCTGNNACDDITCGSGVACKVTCTGMNACGSVNCLSSCACDVTCGAGACGATSCRLGATCTRPGTMDCSSTLSTACSTCPL